MLQFQHTHIYMYMYIQGKRNYRKTEKTGAQTIFPDPFTVCSLYQRKFFVCPFINTETNGLQTD